MVTCCYINIYKYSCSFFFFLEFSRAERQNERINKYKKEKNKINMLRIHQPMNKMHCMVVESFSWCHKNEGQEHAWWLNELIRSFVCLAQSCSQFYWAPTERRDKRARQREKIVRENGEIDFLYSTGNSSNLSIPPIDLFFSFSLFLSLHESPTIFG